MVAIIGILFAITADIYGIAEARSRDQQRLSNLDTINNALEQYHLDNHHYPSNTASGNFLAKLQLEQVTSGTVSCGVSNLAPFYLPNLPEDPLNKLNLATLPSDCSASPAGGYLYVTNVAAASTPAQSFYLMAKMERAQFMSPDGTANTLRTGSFGSSYWGNLIYNSGNYNLVFCDHSTNVQTTCTQNYFKASNPN